MTAPADRWPQTLRRYRRTDAILSLTSLGPIGAGIAQTVLGSTGVNGGNLPVGLVLLVGGLVMLWVRTRWRRNARKWLSDAYDASPQQHLRP